MSSASRCSKPEPEFGSGLLAAAEHDRHLHLVALPQEPLDVTLLGLVVVRVDLGAKLHLLDDGEGLVAPGLPRLLRALVLELAVVHELADRRARHRGHLDQIQIGFRGQFEGLADRHDADLLTLGTDEAYLGYADPVVDPRFRTDGTSQGRRNCRVAAPSSRANDGPAALMCARGPYRPVRRVDDPAPRVAAQRSPGNVPGDTDRTRRTS